ncbi:MAG: hypothetical protein ACM3ZE_01435, partial [Myxococcales bacterium]
MDLQARVRVWGRPRRRSGMRAPRVSATHSVREDARVGAGKETGKGVAGISLVFSGAGTSETVPTDASGVAKWKAATESVDVTFESAEAVNQAMKTVWQSRAATPLDAYLAEGSDVIAITSRASAVEALGGDLFSSLSVAAAQPKTLSIRPAKKRAVLIEMHDTLFRTGSAVV